jgi:hypothetical protein
MITFLLLIIAVALAFGREAAAVLLGGTLALAGSGVLLILAYAYMNGSL